MTFFMSRVKSNRVSSANLWKIEFFLRTMILFYWRMLFCRLGVSYYRICFYSLGLWILEMKCLLK